MQSYGVNFTETWAPTAAARSVRLVISIAAMRNDRVRHIDIKSAYLNAKLTETVYVQPPTGYARTDEVWLLLKALYGLKQAGREWYKMLKTMLIRLGWRPTVSDPCVYYLRIQQYYQLMVVHVDDLIITYANQAQIDSLISGLGQEVKVADLGDLKHALGIDFGFKDHQISLSQQLYVLEVLKRFGFDKCHPCLTPIHESREEYEGSALDKNTGLSKYPLNEIVGSLLWLSMMTRPDITFAVATLAQYVSKPEPRVYSMASRILRYLAGTTSLGINFEIENKKTLHGYADSDWAADKTTRRSQSGYTFFTNGPVDWSSKKQSSVSLSSSEAEVMAFCSATQQAMWFRSILDEIGLPRLQPTVIYEDNSGAIELVSNSVISKRLKHVVGLCFVNHAIEQGVVTPIKVPTEELASFFVS